VLTGKPRGFELDANRPLVLPFHVPTPTRARCRGRITRIHSARQTPLKPWVRQRRDTRIPQCTGELATLLWALERPLAGCPLGTDATARLPSHLL